MRRVAGLVAGGLAMVGMVDGAAAAKRADLALVKVTARPMAAAPGGTVRVADTVRNAGALRARGVRVAYFLSRDARRGGADRRLAGARKLKPLKARARAKGARRVRVPASAAPGAYRLLGCAVAPKRLNDRNRRNDCRTAKGTFRVTSAPAGAVPGSGGTAPAGATPAPGAGTATFPLTPNPLRVSESAESSRAVTQQMYGGFENSISVTSANGTKYTLTLPQNALLSAQEVTMTPVAAVAGTPFSKGLVGAVRLEPHGLELQKPAVLTIEAPAEGPIEEQTAFLYHRGGYDFHPYPIGPERPLTLRLMHFSTAGVALATGADRAAAAARVPRREMAQLEHAVAEAARERRLQAPSRAARAAVPPASVFIAFFDNVVRPKLIAAQTNENLAGEAISQAVSWARNAELIGLGSDPEIDRRRSEMHTRIEIVLRNAVDKAYQRCVQDHDLEQAVRLASLARIEQVHGYNLGDVQDKLLRCVSFEVDFDSRITDTDAWTAPDGRTYDLDAVWRVRSLDLAIDITALGSKALSWAAFSYEGLNTYPCGDQPPLRSYARGVGTTPGTLTALLSLDLNPREPARAGEPPPAPPDDYLQLFVQSQPKETYRHWNEGCDNPYEPADDTQSMWHSRFQAFHPNQFPFKVKIDRSVQTGDLLLAKTWAADKDTGTGTETEFTTLDLWHRPQP